MTDNPNIDTYHAWARQEMWFSRVVSVGYLLTAILTVFTGLLDNLGGQFNPIINSIIIALLVLIGGIGLWWSITDTRSIAFVQRAAEQAPSRAMTLAFSQGLFALIFWLEGISDGRLGAMMLAITLTISTVQYSSRVHRIRNSGTSA